MVSYIEQCEKCFHFQVCAQIMKNQLIIRNKMLKEENPKCEHFANADDVAQVRHGRWIKEHRHRGGFHRYTGLDDMGEQHTITVDERVEYDDRYCSACGKQSADNFLNYCPHCGAKMDLGGVDNG